MEKVPLKRLIDKIKDGYDKRKLYEQEVLCASYLYNFLRIQTNDNYRIFKRLYNELPKKSQKRAINYCVLYVRKQREKQEEISKKINNDKKLKKGK